MNAELENREYHESFMREAIEMVRPIPDLLTPIIKGSMKIQYLHDDHHPLFKSLPAHIPGRLRGSYVFTSPKIIL